MNERNEDRMYVTLYGKHVEELPFREFMFAYNDMRERHARVIYKRKMRTAGEVEW